MEKQPLLKKIPSLRENNNSETNLMTHLPSTAIGLIKHFDQIIGSKEPNLVFRNADIEYILTYHPNYAEKELGFLAHLVVIFSNEARLKKTRLYVLLVSNIDGVVCAEDYVSLNRCIINAIRPAHETAIRTTHIILAFYNTIHGYPIGFSRVFSDICAICSYMSNVFIHSKNTGETFESVVIKFLESVSIHSLMEVEIIITRAGIILKDSELIKQWMSYYKKHCQTWIYICYKCYGLSSNNVTVIETDYDELNEAVSDNDDDHDEDDMITSPLTTERSNHSEVSIRIEKVMSKKENVVDGKSIEEKDSDELVKKDGEENKNIYTKNENGRYYIT